MIEFLTKQFNKEWNLNNNLVDLHWDRDLEVVKPLAIKLITKTLPTIYNRKLKHISIKNTFNKLEQKPIIDSLKKHYPDFEKLFSLNMTL